MIPSVCLNFMEATGLKKLQPGHEAKLTFDAVLLQPTVSCVGVNLVLSTWIALKHDHEVWDLC